MTPNDVLMFRGDDTDAFGGNFIRINLTNNTNYQVKKAVWSCGTVKKTFENPVFPLIINLSSEETDQLLTENTCYLAVYDEFDRKKTCSSNLSFKTYPKKV